MNTTIAYANEWSAEARERNGNNWEGARAAVQERARAEHPVYLGIVNAVHYDSKTDRYIAKCESGSVKVTTEVAVFMLAHAFGRGIHTARPTAYVNINDLGAADRVLLLFVSRD